MALFHIFRSSGISRYFQVLLFCLSEGFKVSEGCFIIFRCTVSQFLSKEFLHILVNDFRSSGIRVCQGFVVRGFQTVSLFVKDVEVFLQVPCTLCVRGFYGLGIGRFLHVQSVCWKFWYQRFLQILFLLLFCGFTVSQMVSSGSLCLSEF